MILTYSARTIPYAFVIAFIFSLTMFSCTSAKHVAHFDEQKSKTAAAYRSVQQNLDMVKKQLDGAKGGEQIDDTTRARIVQIVSALQVKTNRSLDALQQLSYKNGGKPALRAMQKEHKAFDEQVQLLSDNLLLGKLSRVATVVVFPSGQYSLSDTALNGLQELFPKLFKEINSQLVLYPKIRKEVLFSVAGYTDAQSLIAGSDVYRELSAQLPADNRINPDAINKQLSVARARVVKDYIRKAYTDNGSRTRNNTAFYFASYGKGEQLPPTTVAAAAAKDAYRRVALIYWSILPVVE